MNLGRAELHVANVSGVSNILFCCILASLAQKREVGASNNDYGWTLNNDTIIIFPYFIDVEETRSILNKGLNIDPSSYDVIFIRTNKGSAVQGKFINRLD